ncbi:MAG: arginine--tRNA ligase [Candidatus Wallbacteria bacterium]|nr:arginine--tRNA ligase [Candidatus Wallbacteria bacterium]
MIDLLTEIYGCLIKQLPPGLDPAVICEIPKAEFGDLAIPCFVMAREQKRKPQEIAQDLMSRMTTDPDIMNLCTLSVSGGYLNFRFNDLVLSRAMMEQNRRGTEIGFLPQNGQRVVIDFSSPNIAKPFSIGHLRSTSIGNSLSRIMTASGYEVIGINHLGDWGTQFGKMIWAFRRWGDGQRLETEGIRYLLELYVKFHSEAELDTSLEEGAREEFRKLENNDPDNRMLWKKFIEISLSEFRRIYQRLGVEFSYYLGESFYEDKLASTVHRLEEQGILVESEGALVVMLDDKNLPPALIKKSDGTTLYLTRDLASALYRHEFLQADKLVYVVGSEQKMHFQQLKEVIRKLGCDWADQVVHVDFGLFRFAGEKMSTRKGNVIFMDEVMNEAKETVLQIIEEKNPNLPDKEEIAESVGTGAIIFGDLVNERIKNVVFTWEKMLNFEGETGPYVQYAQARCRSILRKAGTFEKGVLPDQINEYERELLREIFLYTLKISKAALHYKPHFIAEAVILISRALNRFYANCPVIKSEGRSRDFRLELIELTANALKGGLYLLGIRAPEEM